MTARIRKIAVNIEETHQEMGKSISPATRKAVAVAVIENPFAGTYVEDLSDLMEIGAELGALLGRKCIEALGISPSEAESYGKSAMVGENGELEHGALWHAPGGYAMRQMLDPSNAIVPSTKKVVGVGGYLDVPITHINASYVRSHFDSMEVGLSDAPRKNEMSLILVMSTGARIHNRAGGLSAADIEGKDGLR